MAALNVWAPAEAVTDEHPTLNRYPQASVTIIDNERYREFSWGGNWEYALPLETPVSEVAEAVIDTLPDEVARVLGQEQ